MAWFGCDPLAVGGAFGDRAVLLQPAQTLRTPDGGKLLAGSQIPLTTFLDIPFRGMADFAWS